MAFGGEIEEPLPHRIARRRRAKQAAPIKNILLVVLVIIVVGETAEIVALNGRVSKLMQATLTTTKTTTSLTTSTSTSSTSTSTSTSTVKITSFTFNTSTCNWNLGIGNYTLTCNNNKLQLPQGSYLVVATAVSSYHPPTFLSWVATGNVTVRISTQNPTTVMVSGNGAVGINYRLYCSTCP